MGAWGHLAFDNDTANDWAYDLDDATDLSLVEDALEALDGHEYLDQDVACVALAACEVLARCLGNSGYKNAYTEKVDAWVAARAMQPSAALLERASTAIDRIVGDNSELRDLWAESDELKEWRASVDDLRRRLRERT